MPNHLVIDKIREKYNSLLPYLNEKTRRIWAATEARSLGWGGITLVAIATGLSRTTIHAGIRLLGSKKGEKTENDSGRIRSSGGGRKLLEEQDPMLLSDLESLIEPMTKGDPVSPLKWTSKSVVKLAEALNAGGHRISPKSVDNLLLNLGYSLQANRKTRDGSSHPDGLRPAFSDLDQQFLHIANQVKEFQLQKEPVISVDTKKKELIGDLKNPGREWCEKQHPQEVKIQDFVDPELGKVIPYGVYDKTYNQGWVNVGIDHDTAELAVFSIRHWWYSMGQQLYPNSQKLMITADCGGSNGYRCSSWKLKLQELATEIERTIYVSHFPPGTSKWNKIEHRILGHITQNWRGRPLTSHEVVINLIRNTTTKQGVKVEARLDENRYPTGIKVTDQEINAIAIERNSFHGEWNYVIKPLSRD
ncbi:ISAzo13 family transposase [Moorena bouillonii]|uniref:ISAzo13 family transposase n=2 Tax=Moorena TaxID=1155738 RepID=A0A1U7N5B1_9CYAN|nr:ISAzo13 family transposase [Moorena bouillonii]OLT61104.1 ISAzo13 family transposase [Moorena bouillonii PNG]